MIKTLGRWSERRNGHTIITTGANELMVKVHDRMPVILHPSDYDRWLDRDSEPISSTDRPTAPLPRQ